MIEPGMIGFDVTFFNELDTGRILDHFKKQGFSSILVERKTQDGFFMSTYKLARKRRVAA